MYGKGANVHGDGAFQTVATVYSLHTLIDRSRWLIVHVDWSFTLIDRSRWLIVHVDWSFIYLQTLACNFVKGNREIDDG